MNQKLREIFLTSALLLSGIAHAQSTALIKVNGVTYTPFDATLDASSGAHVFLNASSDPAQTAVRATQRSLGYREVTYKTALFNTLAFTTATTSVAGSTTTYDFGTANAKTTVIGYWANKDVPIVIGPDGNAYITDGHHTTAGFLQTNLANPTYIIPGYDHPVIGHVVASYYDPAKGPVAPTDAFWTSMMAVNNAMLFGPSGNQLAIATDPGYTGLRPLAASSTPMPKVPGNLGSSAMTNDNYRSLTWGLADGILKSATDSAGKGIKGFSKANSLSPLTPQPDINFVEFFWADFLRNRVVWTDTAAGTALGSDASVYNTAANGQANLIGAPISFFAAVANGTALAKSEVYRDQYGRSIADYTGAAYSDNARSWATSSIANGLAKKGDNYHMYLLDNSTVAGDLTPSALDGVTNTLHVDTTAGQTVAGALKNFTTIQVNAGASISTTWKDSLPALPNSLLTIPAGTGAVVFTGANDYAKLATLAISAGTLEINNPADATLPAVLTGSGGFIKSGTKTLTLSGTSTFTGATTVKAGTLLVSGKLAGSKVALSQGASLTGTGTVGATTNAGLVAPGGTGIGALTIAGDFTQAPTGVLNLQVGGAAAGQYDTLVVQGAAHLGGSLVLENINGYVPRDGDAYNFISATSIDGAFTSVINPLGNALGYSLSTAGGTFQFKVLAVQNSFVPFAVTANQLAVAKALDTTVGDAKAYTLFNRLNVLTGAALPTALDRLSPIAYTQGRRFALSLAESAQSDLRGHYQDLRAGGPLAKGGAGSGVWDLFVSGSMQSGDFGAKAAFPKADFDSSLAGAGVNYRLDKGFVLGASVSSGSIHGDTDADGTNVRVKRKALAVFGSLWSPDRFFAGAHVSNGWSDYRLLRKALGDTLSGTPSGSDVGVGVVAGQEWRMGSLLPRVEGSLDYTRLTQKGATETNGPGALIVDEASRSTVKGRLGGSVAYEILGGTNALRPYVSLFWVNQALDDDLKSTARLASGAGSSFSAVAGTVSRNSLEVGAGISSNLTPSTSLSLGYEGTYNSDYRVHRLDVRANYQF
jgi:autotransporter-associated beta strand protein